MSTATSSYSSAALTWILKYGLGFLCFYKKGTIFASSFIGKNALENPKQIRQICLLIIGLASCIEMTTFWFPSNFLIIAGFANCLKAIAFSSLGASAASLNEHFSYRNNLAEVTSRYICHYTIGTTLGLIKRIYLFYFNQ